MNLKLPLLNSPVIGYQHHAFHLSVMAQHPDFHNWFYTNYIQLCYYAASSKSKPILDFYQHNKNSPLIREMYMAKTMVTPYTSLLTFLKDRIDEGNYIVTFSNEYYIPRRRSYQKHHYVHDILIYGYDSKKDIFEIAGFNDKFSYETAEISSSLIEDALNEFDESTGFLKKWKDGIHLLKIDSEHNFQFDKINVFEQISEYLHSENSSERFRMYSSPTNNIFGISVYEKIQEYLSLNEEGTADTKMFHILYEHKKIMLERLNFMIKLGTTLSPHHILSYEQLKKQALVLRNLCLRAQITKDTSIYNRMIQILEIMKREEEVTMNGLICELKKND